ncbi:MAG TPA: substrate-binding domain-containing protein [Candidatus Mediterraneibacter excrementigallinarum]|nr:substrate-binding domain-containing protein [Candidatus Mediterraneibacter excrementigallinarum]
MKKRLVSAALAMCTVTALCACSQKEEEDIFTGEVAERLPYQDNLDLISPSAYSDLDGLDLEPGTYISVIGKETDSPYWQQVKAGVQQAADDLNEMLGYSGGDSLKITFNAPADGEDIDEQVNILDEEMARYPDVIAIASIDEEASAVQFDLAAENGIPIVAFDSGNNYQGILCTCRTDNSAAAAEGASKLCEAVGDDGEIALIVHDSVSENGKERENGIKEEIEKNHPGVTVVETIYMDKLDEMKRSAAAEQLGIDLEKITAAAEEAQEEQAAAQEENSGEENAAESGEEDASEEESEELEQVDAQAESMSDADVIAYYLGKHPELKGCFGTNDASTQLAVSALDAAGMTDAVTVMGFDAGADQLASLESGDVDGLVVQNPFGMGYATVIAGARTVLEIGNEAEVDTGYVWVDQNNMEDDNIQAFLYE